MATIIEKLESWMKTEDFDNYIKSQEYKIKIRESQLERFYYICINNEQFLDNFIKKVNEKYSSYKYRNRESKLGRIPSEYLISFLFEFAEKYGEEASDEEYNQYDNQFTTALFKYDNYYFHLMQGQGSAIHIFKKNGN